VLGMTLLPVLLVLLVLVYAVNRVG
jgi:hypothetical protein